MLAQTNALNAKLREYFGFVAALRILVALSPMMLVLFACQPSLAQGFGGPVDSGTSQVNAERIKAAAALLQAGNSAFEAGDLKKAEAEWIQARDCAPTGPDWPKAVFNLGLLKEKQGDFRRAIGYFEAVIQSHPNDREPGGNLMETNRNYSHRSAEEISVCYEKLGDYRKALDYALLAKQRYPFQSWCGTCLESANTRLNNRIAYLSARLHWLLVVGFLMLVGTVIAWKRTA